MEAIAKWSQYLLGRHFIIRTDHKSLKELLTQVIQTPAQQHYLKKLLGYNFAIEYKAGAANSAADGLSRCLEMHSTDVHTALSEGQFEFLKELREENQTSPELVGLRQKLEEGALTLD